ncbi:MAG: hypothetical protein QG577_1334, partial [Thermodesulfobacteriota bacterium]|nr:hypothetical protein [Thermodesulfobacteriota bacterium]
MRMSVSGIVKSVFLVVLVVGLCAIGYVGYKKIPALVEQFYSFGKPHSVPGKEVVVTIPKGASLSLAGRILQDNGIIR